MNRDRMLTWTLGPLLVFAFFGVWQFYVTGFDVSAFILPPPTAVFSRFLEIVQQPDTWRHTFVTAYETLVGFLVALGLGVGLGLVVGKVPWLEKALEPFIVASQVIPKVALVPLFVVWFGFGITTKVIVAAVLAFFPIFSNTLLGVKSVELGHRDVMQSLNASRAQVFWKLDLPSALPYVLTGMEVGIVLAVIGAVVGEYLGGNEGLGYMAVASMNAYDTTQLFAVIIQLTLLGFVLYLGIGMLRRWLIPWHHSVFVRL
jgi:NitT/TauT family transport system permease protein